MADDTTDEVELKILASDTTEGTMDDVSTCSRLYSRLNQCYVDNAVSTHTNKSASS